MRSRIVKLFNWRRVLRVTGGLALAGGAVVSIGTVSLSAASLWSINRIRPRTYTDDYHLNPEILRMPYRNVEFSAEDGPVLKGWWIPATVHGRESNRIVILMHPYNNHKSNLLGVASSLWYQGYSIFMFDFRSFVANPKTRQTIGYLEQYDAVAAINYVKNNHYHNKNVSDNDVYSDKQIVVMGASMGGACAICASNNFKDDNIISAIVTDCTFMSLREICKYRIGIASALWFPTGLLDIVVNIMNVANQFIYGYSIDDVSPLDIVRQEEFDIPLLLLHSECDGAVPFHHSQVLYKECKSKIKNLYCIKNGDHCAGYFINPNLFTKYLVQWVDDVLDHEIAERIKKKKEQELRNQIDDGEGRVIINNDFIMFDSIDDIGIDDDNEVENEQFHREQEHIMNQNVDTEQVIIEEVIDSNDPTVNESASQSSMIGYFSSFFKK